MGDEMEYEPVIGLEIHTELKTKSKMFCKCSNDSFKNLPNTAVCPVCLGLPGSLPVMNKKAVELTILCGMALNAKVAEFSKWDRKNYFYPDLPKGYQISQYDLPLINEGYLEVGEKKIGIERIHLEEDTGKLTHPAGANYSLVDYNRAGVPLLELVTKPEIRSGGEAKEFAQILQRILRALEISRADMEKGEMRVEVNISLRKKGEEKFGTKVEVKNLNSFKIVEKAINYEIERQGKILEDGGKIVQETRGWNEKNGKTFSQRVKETAMDYRYFPEPDLQPVEISAEWKKELEKKLGILPEERKREYIEKYNFTPEVAQILISRADLADYFDKLMTIAPKLPVNLVVNWLVHESVNLEIAPKNFADLMGLIDRQVISGTMGKEILKKMNETKEPPEEIIKHGGMRQMGDESEIREVAKKVVAANPQAVTDFGKGKEAAVGFLVGQLMRETKGQAEPQLAQKIIKELLAEK